MMDRLDAAADARGVRRPELIRWLLGSALGLAESDPDAIDAGDHEPPDGSADLSETLVLLSSRARAGVVSAQLGLLRHLTNHANPATPPADPLAEVDELARHNAAVHRRNGDAADE